MIHQNQTLPCPPEKSIDLFKNEHGYHLCHGASGTVNRYPALGPYTYGPENRMDREVVLSRGGSGISNGARSDARWFKTVGVIIPPKPFFALVFSYNSKIIKRRVIELAQAYMA